VTLSDITRHRRAFWSHFAKNQQAIHVATTRGNEHSRWLPVGAGGLIIALYVTNRSVGIFVRGERGTPIGKVRERLFGSRERIGGALGQPDIKLGEHFLLNTAQKLDMQDDANWPRAGAWLAAEAMLYRHALLELLTTPADPFEEPNPFL
jgi:hypothetical protein